MITDILFNKMGFKNTTHEPSNSLFILVLLMALKSSSAGKLTTSLPEPSAKARQSILLMWFKHMFRQTMLVWGLNYQKACINDTMALMCFKPETTSKLVLNRKPIACCRPMVGALLESDSTPFPWIFPPLTDWWNFKALQKCLSKWSNLLLAMKNKEDPLRVIYKFYKEVW